MRLRRSGVVIYLDRILRGTDPLLVKEGHVDGRGNRRTFWVGRLYDGGGPSEDRWGPVRSGGEKTNRKERKKVVHKKLLTKEPVSDRSD